MKEAAALCTCCDAERTPRCCTLAPGLPAPHSLPEPAHVSAQLRLEAASMSTLLQCWPHNKVPARARGTAELRASCAQAARKYSVLIAA